MAEARGDKTRDMAVIGWIVVVVGLVKARDMEGRGKGGKARVVAVAGIGWARDVARGCFDQGYGGDWVGYGQG